MLVPAFSSFPTMFSILPTTNLNFSVIFILSSENAPQLDQSKILLFGKGLTFCHFLHVVEPVYLTIQQALTFPKRQILDLTKLKEFADSNFK